VKPDSIDSIRTSVYVQEGIYDQVIEGLVKKAKESAIGNVSLGAGFEQYGRLFIAPS
jgi:hypothetical protein